MRPHSQNLISRWTSIFRSLMEIPGRHTMIQNALNDSIYVISASWRKDCHKTYSFGRELEPFLNEPKATRFGTSSQRKTSRFRLLTISQVLVRRCWQLPIAWARGSNRLQCWNESQTCGVDCFEGGYSPVLQSTNHRSTDKISALYQETWSRCSHGSVQHVPPGKIDC